MTNQQRKPSDSPRTAPTFAQALIAGGIAGTAVDTALFPLDTVKTRLQAKGGFWAHGGFKGIYSGLSSAVLGSAPGAAAFFVTYEQLKRTTRQLMPSAHLEPLVHMVAASGGEIVRGKKQKTKKNSVFYFLTQLTYTFFFFLFPPPKTACFIRVPTEIVKQRMQTGQYASVAGAARHIVATDGVRGFYRGYAMTIFREIPFTCIQFPLYEHLKQRTRTALHRNPNAGEAALCASLAGGVAAALTTPLDVVKTRIMLESGKSKSSVGNARDTGIGTRGIWATARTLVATEGPARLFAGIGPRVLWISIGGTIFLGAYEAVVNLLAPPVPVPDHAHVGIVH
ncbi:mitochondrial carrier domain-containing protein [Powellomyces hirtus]|nr:mitochondrial carrier domain-containing protein [Powellomyces hirtus]